MFDCLIDGALGFSHTIDKWTHGISFTCLSLSSWQGRSHWTVMIQTQKVAALIHIQQCGHHHVWSHMLRDKPETTTLWLWENAVVLQMFQGAVFGFLAMLFAELPMDSDAFLLISPVYRYDYTYIYTRCYTHESEGIISPSLHDGCGSWIFSFCTKLPPTYMFTWLTKEGESVLDMNRHVFNDSILYDAYIFLSNLSIYMYMRQICSSILCSWNITYVSHCQPWWHDTGIWPVKAGNLDDFTFFLHDKCVFWECVCIDPKHTYLLVCQFLLSLSCM